MMEQTTIDKQEVENFSSLASKWWDEEGPFKILHLMNKVRLQYIRDQVVTHYNLELSSEVFSGLDFLDVGCGGGILSVPLKKLGANVTGIDASEQNIKIAKMHAEEIEQNIDFINTAAEEMPDRKFDVICCLEIVEHVNNLELFFSSVCNLLKPGGIIFISTINKTALSYLKAIIGAEWVMRYVPIGTHQWNKFLKPSQIVKMLKVNEVDFKDMSGMTFNPIFQEWSLSEDVKVNYILTATKC